MIESIQDAVNEVLEEEDETGLIFLDDRLVHIMNLNSLPKVNKRTIYSHSGLIKWWLIYVSDNGLINVQVKSNTSLNALNVTVDNLISNLTGLISGSHISFYDFSILLFNQYTEPVNIPVPVEIIYEIGVELGELYDIVSRYGLNI